MGSVLKKSENSEIALHGGKPVREIGLPYGRHEIRKEDVDAVVKVLGSDWLTTGPEVSHFENEICKISRAKFCVSVINGTAALHTAYHAIGIQAGDEVIVPALTFAATANAAIYCGAKPVFCDVDPHTLLIDTEKVSKLINERTKAIVAVDYAGVPANYRRLREIADKHDLWLVADASHSIGAEYERVKVGTLADLTTFSFHPVKHITTGEGGAICTNHEELASRMRQFRNHGITTDHRQRERLGTWHYDMDFLGCNYRLSDLQCALGTAQLKHLDDWIKRRQEIVDRYRIAFAEHPALSVPKRPVETTPAYHLFVVLWNLENWSVDRDSIFRALRAEGIGVNVHYRPVYLHPYYLKENLGRLGLCPESEKVFERITSLPLFPSMSDHDVSDVILAVEKVWSALRKN